MCKRFPMKTHPIVQSALAALAALVLACTPNLSAQTPVAAAPEQKAEAKGAKPAPTPTVDPHAAELDSMNISLAYEAFSLPIAKAGELQRKGMTDDELYKEVVAAGKLERLLILRTKSGQRAQLENATNYIYPTEFSPPQLAGSFMADKTPPPPVPPIPATPTAFGNKEAGDTLEAEPTISKDLKSVDFQFQVSHVRFARREKWGQGLAELEQPLLETQKLTTNVSAAVGSPRLVGTLNPVFGNGLANRTDQHVWLCFITVTIAKDHAAPQKKSGR